jgi:DNA-binding CsgD family transcriptional regulator
MPSDAGLGPDDLVERDEVLAALTRLVDRAADGHGAAVRLLGEAGAGKTAVVRAVTALAAERGLRLLTTSAAQLEAGSPYGVVRRLFDRPLVALDEEERQAVLDGPARLAADHVLGGDPAPVEQGDLLSSLYWLLDGLGGLGPVLLAVDDAQWADEESLLFLGSLRERLATLPVLVVLASREVPAEDRSPALAALLADRDAVELRLQPLSPVGVRTLLTRGLGDPVAPEVGAAAAEVTGGNPFLVLALTRLLTGVPELTGEGVRAAVPTTVIDTVVARLASLGAAERALARAVAVLERASTRVAGDLAGLELGTASAAADRLRGAGLLGDEATLGFRHALLRSAVYSAMGAGLRDELHRAAARLLADDLHAAGAHLAASSGAGDPWAVDLLRRAAAAALAEGAPHTAVGLLRRAVAEPPAPDDLAVVRLELGLAEMRTTDPACVASLGAAEAGLTEPADRARCALALGEAFNYAGMYEAAADVLERADAALVDAEPDLRLTVEAALVAASLLVPARIAEARRRLADHPGLTGASPGERLLLVQQLANAAGTNEPAPVLRGLVKLALDESDTPETTQWAWARLFLAAIGEYDEVRRLTDDGFAQAAAKGSVVGFVTVSFLRGVAEYWSGALVPAEAHYRALKEYGAALNGGLLVELLGDGNLAQTLAWQGRVEEGLALLAPFPEELPANAPVNGVVTMAFARASVRTIAGDHAGALRAAEYAGRLVAELDVDSPTWAAWRAFAVGPLRSLGRLEEARRLAAEHLVLCERSGVVPLLGEALRLVAEVSEDQEEALTLLRRSVALLAGSQARLQEASSQHALGAALRRAGLRTEAQAHLLVARELAQGCGARGLVGQVEEELAACGTRVRRLELSGVAALTASERRVAELAARGLRNSEIARQLFVTTKTVETHLSRSYRKLGVSGRDELAEALG